MEPLDRAHDTRRARTPLLGRAAEVSRFERLLADGRRGLVLHGSPGCGMTRLAEELVGIAEASGLAARFVRGRSAIADVPLAAFAPLLSGEVERYEGVSLLVAARTAIADLGGGRPLALGVDDVHLLDPTSATLVNQLVTAGSVIVVATVHDGEWVPEPISELWRNGHIERWPVGDLGPAEAIAMANALLDTDLAPDAADDLVRLTGCNPLFVSTLARAMNETGTTTELDTVAAAPKLVDFVAGRLHWLDPAGRDALAVVALGEPIGLGLLERLTDASSLVDLERGGWITVTEEGRRTDVRLAHPLYGEVLRRNLSRLLARTVYRELAAEVQAHGARRGGDLMRVAAWSLDGGAPVPAERLVAAANEAMQVGDFVLAERLAEVVWDAGPRFDAGIILLLIHETRRFQADREGFLRTLAGCVETPIQLAQVASIRSYEAFWRNADLTGALRLVDDAIEQLERAARRRATRSTNSAPSAPRSSPTPVRTSRHERSSRSCGRRTCRVSGRSSATPNAWSRPPTATPGASSTGSTSSSRRRRRGPTSSGCSLHAVRQAGLAKTLVQTAQAERAEVLVREAIDASSGDSLMARTPETQLAWVLMWRGKANEGYGYAHRAATHQQRHGFRTLERWSRGVMAMCAAHAGDHDAAERALLEVDALSPIPVVMWDADVWHARTMMAWLRQDIDEGQRWARFGVAESAPRGLRFDEALGWYLLARFGGAREALEPLQAFADELGGLPALFAMYARALVSARPGRARRGRRGVLGGRDRGDVDERRPSRIALVRGDRRHPGRGAMEPALGRARRCAAT